MTIKGRQAVEFVYVHITGVNNGQSKFKYLGDVLCSKIETGPSTKKDQLFNDSFKKWDKNPAKKKQIQSVANDISFMEMENTEMFIQFANAMKVVDEMTVNIATGIAKANSLFDKLLETNDMEEVKISIESVASILIEIMRMQSALSQHFQAMRMILKDYNRKRRLWAEFMIGMRVTRSTSRKPVKPTMMTYIRNLASIALTKMREMIGFGNKK